MTVLTTACHILQNNAYHRLKGYIVRIKGYIVRIKDGSKQRND